jgi:hypothetical protein
MYVFEVGTQGERPPRHIAKASWLDAVAKLEPGWQGAVLQ